jgi:hypothetical protein
MTQSRWRLVAATAAWLTACSSSPRATQTSAAAPLPSCTVADGRALPASATDTAAALRKTIESGPLFAAFAATTAVSRCQIGADDGATFVEYQFRDGGSLRAKRDPRIEFSEFDAQFAAPPREDPITILTGAERAAFGADGCGIDWKDAETRTPDDRRAAVEKIYRGDTCNCQARVRTDAAGRVVGLILRSTC